MLAGAALAAFCADAVVANEVGLAPSADSVPDICWAPLGSCARWAGEVWDHWGVLRSTWQPQGLSRGIMGCRPRHHKACHIIIVSFAYGCAEVVTPPELPELKVLLLLLLLQTNFGRWRCNWWQARYARWRGQGAFMWNHLVAAFFRAEALGLWCLTRCVSVRSWDWNHKGFITFYTFEETISLTAK